MRYGALGTANSAFSSLCRVLETSQLKQGFPFDNGRKFTIRIMTTPDCYRILVNNWDFVCFNHRIPPSEVRYLQLTDGAEYYETLVQNNCVSPCSLLDGVGWGLSLIHI